MQRASHRSLLLLLGLLSACGGSARELGGSGAGGASHGACSACVVGHDAAGDSSGGEGGDGGSAGDRGLPDVNDTASIGEISFWQALRVPLELSGRAVPPNAPIIAHKDGILRVYIAPGSTFHARQLSATLELGGAQPSSFNNEKLVRAASLNAEFASTFNFPIDAALVDAEVSYSVTVRDGDGGRVIDRYPLEDRSALGADTAGPALNVVVVPIVVSGITPDVSPSKMALFSARVRSMYPLANVTITTRDPITTRIEVGPNQGWDAILDLLYAQRAADSPLANVYYYGMFTPTTHFDDYCVSDCTVGYSIVADASDVEDRGSVGLGIFSDGSNSSAPDTMAHELGHALGRDHAPCDVSLQDSGPFPYKGGKIGVWGFDSVNHALLDPLLYGDVMGYCSPDWISDFTYRALFKRIKQVNAEVSGTQAQALPPRAGAYRRVLWHADGSLGWGSSFTPRSAPTGELRSVSLLGAEGALLGVVDAVVRHSGAAAGGFLLIPEAVLNAPGVRVISLGNARLTLPAP